MKKVLVLCVVMFVVFFDISAASMIYLPDSDLYERLDEIYDKMIYWDEKQANIIDSAKKQISGDINQQNVISEKILEELKRLNDHFGNSTSNSLEEFKDEINTASEQLKKVDELIVNVKADIEKIDNKLTPIETDFEALNDKYDTEMKSITSKKGALTNDWISQAPEHFKQFNLDDYYNSYERIKKDSESISKNIDSEIKTVQKAISLLDEIDQQINDKVDKYYAEKASGKTGDDGKIESFTEAELNEYDVKVDFMDNVAGRIAEKRQEIEEYETELNDFSKRIEDISDKLILRVDQLNKHKEYVKGLKKK